MDDDEVLARPDADDHEVLTVGEAGARITEEIALQKQRVTDRRARLEAGEAVREQLAASEHRLALLRDAAQRNARPPLSDEAFQAFFGYPREPA